MDQLAPPVATATPLDGGLRALCGIAAYFRIGADPVQLARELALEARLAQSEDIVRAAQIIGLKARIVTGVTELRLAKIPTPAIVQVKSGAFLVFGVKTPRPLN